MTQMQIEKTTHHYTHSIPGVAHIKVTITVPRDDADWEWTVKAVGLPVAINAPNTLTNFRIKGETREQTVDGQGRLTMAQTLMHGAYWGASRGHCITPDELAAMFKIEER